MIRDELRKLHVQAGAPSFNSLKQHAERRGHSIGRSTLAAVLTGTGGLRWATVEAFVEGCVSYAKSRGQEVPPDLVDMSVWRARFDQTNPPDRPARTQPLPAYLGRIVNGDGVAVGTCFQVAPRVLVTTAHIVDDTGAALVGDVVRVEALAGGHGAVARILRLDRAHDLAILVRDEALDASVSGFVQSDSVNELTEVVIAGAAHIDDHRVGYQWLQAVGVWAGSAVRDDGVTLGRVRAQDIVPGMSGAPVRLLADDRVVGVVVGRYSSADGWLRDNIWIARTEDISPLVAGLSVAQSQPRSETLPESDFEAVPLPDLPGVAEPARDWQLRLKGFGDRPADRDLLRRGALVETIYELIRPLRSKPEVLDTGHAVVDAPNDADATGPIVVALDGPWGSGKTTIARFIQERLGPYRAVPTAETPRRLRAWEADRALRNPRHHAWRSAMLRRTDAEQEDPQVTIINFEPWAHQTGEQVWSGLTNSLLSGVRRDVLPEIDPLTAKPNAGTERYWFQQNIRRTDNLALRRTLWRQVASPFMALGFLALFAPIVAQMARSPDTYLLAGHKIAGSNIAVLISTLIIFAVLFHTLWRYLAWPARSVLPVELFVGPVLSGSLASASDSLPSGMRDPYHHSRAGYLYLLQHDVFSVLESLKDAGYAVVVFIDDLDRCTPSTVTQVFEAINIFVSVPFPVTRFVISLDTLAVAANVDAAYASMTAGAPPSQQAGGISPAWGAMRKLIQLSVPLPQTVGVAMLDLLGGLLNATTGPSEVQRSEAESADLRSAATESSDPKTSRTGPDLRAFDTPLVRSDYSAGPTTVAATPSNAMVGAVVAALEAHPLVIERFAERLVRQPDVTTRDVKRLVTMWQFCVRVATRVQPLGGPPEVNRARHIVLLAELLVRWPESQRLFLRRLDGELGLSLLARSATDERDWAQTLNRLDLTGPGAVKCANDIRSTLAQYDAAELVKLAELLF